MHDPRRPTLRDVAAKAGVSTQTAAYAITAPHRLAPPTVARVREAVNALEYVPNAAARALRDAPSPTVAVAVADLRLPGLRAAVSAIDRALWGEAALGSEIIDQSTRPLQGSAFNAARLRCAASLELAHAEDDPRIEAIPGRRPHFRCTFRACGAGGDPLVIGEIFGRRVVNHLMRALDEETRNPPADGVAMLLTTTATL